MLILKKVLKYVYNITENEQKLLAKENKEVKKYLSDLHEKNDQLKKHLCTNSMKKTEEKNEGKNIEETSIMLNEFNDFALKEQQQANTDILS